MAPPQGQMRPSRYLAVLALIFVVLAALVFLGGKGSVSERLKPKLGLDLIGGTTVTFTAQTEDGKDPSADSLEEARQIIESRVNGLGVAEPEVVTEGGRNIVVNVAGHNDDAIKQVGTPAQLRFRKVLNVTQDTGLADATPTPSASATPGASGSATPKPAASASAGATPAATTPAATPAASGSAGATSAPALPLDKEKRREAVLAKVDKASPGAAAAAQGVTSPDQVTGDAALQAKLAPFKTLSGAEVAALSAEMQFNLPQITCTQLNGRPAGSVLDPKQTATGCDATGSTKYLMDVAKVLGTDVNKATATINSQTSQWQVDLSFKSSGQTAWTNLTKEAYNNTDSKCAAASLNEDQRCAVAVVLDNEVVSAPSIISVITGDATINGGSIDQQGAKQLANQLRYGALPLTFTQSNSASITATLGSEQLKAGLLAAGIGMALVVVYAFFYYRMLGAVIFLSLALSGVLTFGALVLLGRSIGFTLTLAGIAGFIVSLGVAADSFVIYFERLKDEIREGRSPRSAVPRAWHRARRTIITANVVTLLAAATLYMFGVSAVRGFAFALGLATLLDLVIVFLFRHPIMTMFARTPAFLSPRVSGLGRVLQHAEPETPVRSTTRTKEA